jgi:hypothetical protein
MVYTCSPSNWLCLLLSSPRIIFIYFPRLLHFTCLIYHTVTYPGFAWLKRRVLDLMIEFNGPSYSWLQQFTNHYLTHCHLLPTGRSTGTIPTSNWTELHCQFKSKLCYDRRYSRPVCLGIKHPSGAYDQIFITVNQLRVCWCGVLSLTRGPVCRLPDSVGFSLYNLASDNSTENICCLTVDIREQT